MQIKLAGKRFIFAFDSTGVFEDDDDFDQISNSGGEFTVCKDGDECCGQCEPDGPEDGFGFRGRVKRG